MKIKFTQLESNCVHQCLAFPGWTEGLADIYEGGRAQSAFPLLLLAPTTTQEAAEKAMRKQIEVEVDEKMNTTIKRAFSYYADNKKHPNTPSSIIPAHNTAAKKLDLFS